MAGKVAPHYYPAPYKAAPSPTVPFVFVYWDDAHSLEATTVVNIEKLDDLHKTLPMITSGWLLKEDEKGVSVGSEYCGDNDFRNTTHIQKRLIHLILRVKVPHPPKFKGPHDEAFDGGLLS